MTPGLKSEGNTNLYTQTFWTNNSDTIIVQVITIDEYNVWDKYIYHKDLQNPPYFPQDFSFGKKLIRVPPGKHDIKISYNGEGRYLIGSRNLKHRELISYEVSIPADSICVFTPEVEVFNVDIYQPRIRLECRKKRAA